MTCTGVEFFMEKLEQMLYRNDNPLINNHPSILSEIPQIQLLYEELRSMAQTLFFEDGNKLYELEEVKNLRRRFKDIAQEAQDIIDLFVFDINHGNERLAGKDDVLDKSLNLEGVTSEVKSIKVEFMSLLTNNMKIDKSPCIKKLEKQSAAGAAGARTISSIGKKKLQEEIVGFDRDAELIRDKLVEDKKQLDVVSIVGMGGLGKTTLATKVFNDPFVLYHFHVRGWATVSQTYNSSDILIQILSSIGVQLDTSIGIKRDTPVDIKLDTSIAIKLDTISNMHSRLREMLYKRLKFKRYLIVIDDLWGKEAWDDLKLIFPNDNTGSRILLTSRLKEVAFHAKPHSFIHQLSYLTEDESWVLLRKKVFDGDDCPERLIKAGMQIAKNCHGLPLAVVVIAGVLAKKEVSNYWWDRIAQSVSSFIVSNPNKYVETLALSFDHLPSHLRDCFLYLGGFPEDYKFTVTKLIRLWMAEGFIQKVGNQSLEKTGEEYLIELVDRNLLVVKERKSSGAIKVCSLHDLLRELCLEKATKEHFLLKIHESMSRVVLINRYKARRVFINGVFFAGNSFGKISPKVQSLLCFERGERVRHASLMCFERGERVGPAKWELDYHSYPLLMVLNVQNRYLIKFPQAITTLVHIRYLAFRCKETCFPTSICNLWNLQTLIAEYFEPLLLPNTISNLTNLRHLQSNTAIYFPSLEKPMNLLTISKAVLVDGAESWVKYIPGIKKLTCSPWADEDHDFESLTSLETLVCLTEGLVGVSGQPEYPDGEFRKIHMTLPASLKKLSLSGCCLPWSDMSILQSLPNLEVLKLLKHSFVGSRWETCEGEFQQLTFLKLQDLNIQQWEASSINFPCLKQLVLERCKDLEEIPLELGDIPTLELIEVDESLHSVVESLDRIQEEQHDMGNYELKTNVREAVQSFTSFRKYRGVL